MAIKAFRLGCMDSQAIATADELRVGVQDGENLRVIISYANRGGLIGVCNSMVVFIPFSRIPKAPGVKLSMEVGHTE